MIGVLLASLLAVSDPVGDTSGNGSLAPPSSVLLADAAEFDLHEVAVLDENNLVVTITMGSLSNPGSLVNGFSNPIIEVYVDSAEGGATTLLPGSGLALPAGMGWEAVLKITGDEASGFRSDESGETQANVRFPVGVTISGRTLTVATPFARPEKVTLFVMVGVYDPFSETGWRSVTETPSPWGFSSDTQLVPVVDLLATTVKAQRAAIDSGVLPSISAPRRGTPWLLLMGLGMAVALVGLAMRGRLGLAAPGRGEVVGASPGTPTADPVATRVAPLEAPPPDLEGVSEAAIAGPDFMAATPDDAWLVEELEVPEAGQSWPLSAAHEEERHDG